jgi:hypothetical protein
MQYGNMNVIFKISTFCLQCVFKFFVVLKINCDYFKGQGSKFLPNIGNCLPVDAAYYFFYSSLKYPITNSDYFVTEHQNMLICVGDRLCFLCVGN